MKRIIVIGCPGAGKSTFARKLRDKTGLPLYYLDMIWHLPDRTTLSREEFDAKLTEILTTDEWIIDGNYGRTLETRLKACDTVFLLDYPPDVCLEGAEKRVGQNREEIPWIEEKLDEDFRQWILDFPDTQLPCIYQLLKQYNDGRQIYVLRSRKEADAWFEDEGIEMKNGKTPDPNTIHPIAGYDKEIYAKPTIKDPNIIVGDFTYIADSEFESHVTHHYAWNGDKLMIGKFCQIAAGVEFVMNGANHQMNAVSTFPFYTLEGWSMDPPARSDLPIKGDTVIGNDVWIGQNAVILPGVHIGDGVIIGANSVVGSDIEPYAIVVGNPAKMLRKRFDDELIGLLLRFKWWDKSIEEIDGLIPILTCSDLEKVKKEIKARL